MKSIFKSVLLLGVMMMAYSCVLDDIDTQITDEEAIANIKLECDALDSYTVQATKPQAISFRISSTTPWTIEGADKVDWLTVTPASSSVSSLSEDIRITAGVNETFADRSATITVTGKNTNISKNVTITQLRHGKLVVNALTDHFTKSGNSQTFSLQSNLHWEATAADSWLTLEPTSGDSDGDLKTFNVKATASANEAITRETTITVTSGDDVETFKVIQRGESLEILPGETSIDRKGGSLTFTVDASMEWNVSCDNPAFTVTKLSNTEIKVSAGFNNVFAERKGKVTIKPVSTAFGDIDSSVEISQGVNFDFSGHYDILDDGSIKIYGDQKSKVTTKDGYRYASFVLTMGEKHFEASGILCLSTHDAGASGNTEYECQIRLGSKLRLRSNGSDTDYNTQSIEITQDEMNALTTYRMDFAPDSGNIRLEFFYNGTSRASMTTKSAYESDPSVSGHYFFGYDTTGSDGTWYVVKSCDITEL